MDLKTFLADVAAKTIVPRLKKEPAPTLLEDWHYQARNFTTLEAQRYLERFFREHTGTFDPKPGQFGHWLKEKRIGTDQETESRFKIDWPAGKTFVMVRVTHNEMPQLGFIERRQKYDMMHLYRRGFEGRWITECVTPDEVRRRRIEIYVMERDVPRNWYCYDNKPPEGLEALLEREF